MADPLGLDSGVVRLVDYDDRWPLLFADEERRIRGQCGSLALTLEPIGGTSIPGLCAKPVIDIAAGRPAEGAIGDSVAAFERAGCVYRGERGVPRREYFRRGQPRSYHLHLVEEGSGLWSDYIAFRDYLRAHSQVAREFADVKRVLAARFAHDRDAYLNAKGPHVLEILRRARPSGTTGEGE